MRTSSVRRLAMLSVVIVLLLVPVVLVMAQDSGGSHITTIPMTQILNKDQAAIELLTRNGVPPQLISEIQASDSLAAEENVESAITPLAAQSDWYVVCPGYEWGNAIFIHGGPATGRWEFCDGFAYGAFAYCTDPFGCLTLHQARRGPGVSPTHHTVVADWISLHNAWCS